MGDSRFTARLSGLAATGSLDAGLLWQHDAFMPRIYRTFVILLVLSVLVPGRGFPVPAYAATEIPPAASSGLAYNVEITAPEGMDELADEMRSNSQLLWLRDQIPESRVALERRMLADVETAEKILRSQGYYEGKTDRSIQWDSKPVLVRIRFEPGPRTTTGRTRIVYRRTRPAAGGEPPLDDEKVFPTSLAAFGLSEGSPATAEAVLDAVKGIAAHLERQGYPRSRVIDTDYIVITSTRHLQATVTVDTGPFVRMGRIRAEGAPSVSETYLQRMTPWENGAPWNAASIQAYRTALQETGLFSLIDIRPDIVPGAADGGRDDTAPTTGEEISPVLLTLKEAPARTVSGGARYSTDTGFGVMGAWEHRNLFGGGERLRVSAPIAEDLQMISLSFRKPEFGRHNQHFVAEAEGRNETTDAYDQTAGYLAAGIERRFDGDWRNWWGSVRVSAEAGEINDHLQGRRTYALFGLPLGLRRDTTDDMFNPTRGTRLSLNVTPYTGFYDGPLTTVRTRLDASGYLKVTESNRLVLAARAGVGSLTGESLAKIPASLRFYVGGGGSVRGYEYLSIGPENEDGDPTGGLSFTDVGLEARFRIGENFGIVPFIDGGMVYDDEMPKFGKDMEWGVGIGFRYYTSIGPVRLDVAVPLQDRDNQKSFQLYLSLGQAF